MVMSVPGWLRPSNDRSIFWYSFPERGRSVDVDGRFNLRISDGIFKSSVYYTSNRSALIYLIASEEL